MLLRHRKSTCPFDDLSCRTSIVIVVSSSLLFNSATSSDERRSCWKCYSKKCLQVESSFLSSLILSYETEWTCKNIPNILHDYCPWFDSCRLMKILPFLGQHVFLWSKKIFFACLFLQERQKNYRIFNNFKTGAANVPLNTTVNITIIDVVVYINRRASVDTFRTANAKAKAPRKPENIIIVCQRQLIWLLRVILSKNDKSTTQNIRDNVMAI